MSYHENLRYWVWLQRAAGKGANLERLLERFGGDVRALYEMPASKRDRLLRETPAEGDQLEREEARVAGLHKKPTQERRGQRDAPSPSGANPKARKRRPIAPSTLDRLKKISLSEADDVLALCERTGIIPLCPEDEHYPWLLREVPTHPAVLYALGDVSLLTPTTLPFAMVGARDARLSSLCAASDVAGTLARAGLLIVSGGAIGTDSACHIGALNADCPTVAVLGTGIGTRYLQQNADLRRVISHNGLLLSEMEPGEPGSRGSFPLRNRIIAGMSIGTLVVEAAVKSGSLITSRFAEEYDRDVFVPLFPGVDPSQPLSSDPTSSAPGSPLFTRAGAGATSRRHTSSGRGGSRTLPSFRGSRELLERETGVGIRCAADILIQYADEFGIDLAELVAAGQVSVEDLTRDITDLAGVFPPLLSRSMIAQARAELGLCTRSGPATSFAPDSSFNARAYSAEQLGTNDLWDLAGEGTLNRHPGWGPYRTAADVELRTYTSAEFAYRRGDHPLAAAAASDPVSATSDTGQAATADDSREKFWESCGESPKKLPEGPLKPFKDLSTEAKLVLSCFRDPAGQPLYYDDLAARLDLAPQYLLAALTELLLASYIDLTMDQRYVSTVDLETEGDG